MPTRKKLRRSCGKKNLVKLKTAKLQRAVGIAALNHRQGVAQISKLLYRRAPSLRGLKPSNRRKSARLRCAGSLDRYASGLHRLETQAGTNATPICFHSAVPSGLKHSGPRSRR